MSEEEITEFVRTQLTLPGKLDPADELSWQHHLYSTLGNKKFVTAAEMKQEALDLLVQRIVAMGKVLYGLHSIDHPSSDASQGAFPKVSSKCMKYGKGSRPNSKTYSTFHRWFPCKGNVLSSHALGKPHSILCLSTVPSICS